MSSTLTSTLWDTFVKEHRDGHLFQCSDWGRVKHHMGWTAEVVTLNDPAGHIIAGVQILYRPLRLHLGYMAYIAAGPLFYSDNPTHISNTQLWALIAAAIRRRRACFLRVEPCDWYRPRPDLATHLTITGFQPSLQNIEPVQTIVIDIEPDEQTIFKNMNQSTRYKVKLGPKKEVDVRLGTLTDMASFNRLLAITSARNGFSIEDPGYYQNLFEVLSSDNRCVLLMASHAGQDLAGIIVARHGRQAYYLYGGSTSQERDRMPAYILQWHAIQWAKMYGATVYDLCGIAEADVKTLETQFTNRHDGLWGLYGFKRGFGGQVMRSTGSWDKVYNSALYTAYVLYLRSQNIAGLDRLSRPMQKSAEQSG